MAETVASASPSKKDNELPLNGWSRAKYNFYLKFAQLGQVDWESPEANAYGREAYGLDAFGSCRDVCSKRRSRTRNALQGFYVREGKLFSDPKNGEKPRIVVSSDQIPNVLKQFHDNIGHPGIMSTFRGVTEVYTAISRDTVVRYIRQCKNCQNRLMKEEHVRPLRKAPMSASETETLVALWEHYRSVLFCPKSQEHNATMRQAQNKAWEDIANQMNLFYPESMRESWDLKHKFRSMVSRVKQKLRHQEAEEAITEEQTRSQALTATEERVSVLIQEAGQLEADLVEHNYFSPDVILSSGFQRVEEEVLATETGGDTDEANTPETRGVKRAAPDTESGMSQFERRMIEAYEKQTTALNKIQRTLDSLVKIQGQRLLLEQRQQPPRNTSILHVPQDLDIGNAGPIILEAVSVLPEDL